MRAPRIGFRRRLRCILLAPLARRFWDEFPSHDQPGPWVAEAIVTGISYRHVRKSELVRGGMWDAYIRARDLAVDVDLNTPRHPDGEVGVEWGVRKPTEEELKPGERT
jgi:hypothetical protein